MDLLDAGVFAAFIAAAIVVGNVVSTLVVSYISYRVERRFREGQQDRLQQQVQAILAGVGDQQEAGDIFESIPDSPSFDTEDGRGPSGLQSQTAV